MTKQEPKEEKSFQSETKQQKQSKAKRHKQKQEDKDCFDTLIGRVEDEQTDMAKSNTTSK